ncbi:hypothetical protein AVM71_03290 [Piscirickettsia salmonis]|nr:hypothetical protein AVM71_03290 [Piscirickettsia salmonis]
MTIKILDNIEIRKNNLKESFEIDVLAGLSSKKNIFHLSIFMMTKVVVYFQKLLMLMNII